jgi:hypothetical protein
VKERPGTIALRHFVEIQYAVVGILAGNILKKLCGHFSRPSFKVARSPPPRAAFCAAAKSCSSRPVATAAEAERMLFEYAPDVALVDLHLRDGELSDDLIARLYAQDIAVVIIFGSAFLPLRQGKAATILEKLGYREGGGS